MSTRHAHASSQALPLLRTETVNLDEALGRVAARSEKARMFSPPFDVSAMDGYAVRTFDVPDGGISLPLLGESRAGASPIPVLKPGTCMRVFTGAPIPSGADSVIIQENASPDNGRVLFTAAAVLGQHVRTKGGSFRLNDPCLDAGRTVTARDIGFIAAAGHSAIEVVRRPRIGVLSTGDELARWSRKAGPGQIHDANRPALKAAIRAWGGEPVDLGIAPDDPEAIADAVKGSASDLLGDHRRRLRRRLRPCASRARDDRPTARLLENPDAAGKAADVRRDLRPTGTWNAGQSGFGFGLRAAVFAAGHRRHDGDDSRASVRDRKTARAARPHGGTRRLSQGAYRLAARRA